MKLNELEIGECGKIISIESDPILKSRFSSFGICRGNTAYIIEQTIAKNTIEVRVKNTNIALRVSEAKLITVEKTPC